MPTIPRIPRVNRALIALSGVLMFVPATTLRAQVPSSLKPAVQELRATLDLSDAQVAQAEPLVVDRVKRVEAAIDQMGDVSFDSVVGLLDEVRSIKDEFFPSLGALLSDEQRALLGQLPRDHGIYVSAMAGWLSEGRVRKLKERVGIDEGQAQQIREAVTGQYRDGVEIVSELVGGAGTGRKQILDAVLDLRGVIRKASRDIERVLTEEQRSRLDALKQKEAVDEP